MGLQHNHTHGHLPLAKLKTLMWGICEIYKPNV